MEIILNVGKDGYNPFLKSKVDAFILSLKDYSIGEAYPLTFFKIKKAIKEIHENNKKVYININFIPNEDELNKFKKVFNDVLNLNPDQYIVSDLGVLNMFKNKELLHKVIYDSQTYICNKFTAKFFLDLGVSHIVLPAVLTEEEIEEISSYNNCNVEVLFDGYPIISISKRKIISTYLKNNNLEKKGNLYYLKEETRNSLLPVIEDTHGMYVYNFEPIRLSNNILSKVNYVRINSFLRSKTSILNTIKEVAKLCKK